MGRLSQLCQEDHVLDGGVKLIIPEVMDPVSQKTCAPTSRKSFEHSLSGMKGNPLSWIP